MNSSIRLLAYAAGLIAVFGASFVISGAIAPDSVVAGGSQTSPAEHQPVGSSGKTDHTTTSDHGGSDPGDGLPAALSMTSRTAAVGGFDVTLAGSLQAGAAADLTVTVRRNDRPVATLQPYLGAFGHLVVLRTAALGDLHEHPVSADVQGLHVHPDGAPPGPGAVSGPDVEFVATAPTTGWYLLRFDFQVDNVVHTARFVLATEVY